MKKVLIAVKSETLGEDLAALLCVDFEVRVCRQEEALVPLCRQWLPDAVVLDVSLTGIKYRDILRFAESRHTTLVFLTPFLDDTLLYEAEQSSNIHILRIPCSADTVVSHIWKLLTTPTR